MKTIRPTSSFKPCPHTRWVPLLAACAVALIAHTTRGDSGAAHRSWQPWPISLGTSGGNINAVNNPITPTYCCSGTLGALVQDDAGNQYILGSAILALAGAGQIGDAITQPGTIDYRCGTEPFSEVAYLSAYVPLQYYYTKNNKPPNYVSAAIAQVRNCAVKPGGDILDIGPVNSVTTAPSLGLKVKKSGRQTGLTFGSIKAINVAVDADGAPTACNSTAQRNARMVNQFKISSGFAVMTQDSGSLVVTDEPGLPRPVGIVWAHSPTFVLACPIDAALTQLSEDLSQRVGSPRTLSFPPIHTASAALGISGADTVAGAARATDSALSVAVPNDLINQIKVERALLAQERHFKALFNVPDVVGHGIGLSDEDDPVIEVYLRNENARSRARIPAALDNVPVRVLVTGPFTAN